MIRPDRQRGALVLKVLGEEEVSTHVTLRGFTLEACRGTAVTISGGTHSRIAGWSVIPILIGAFARRTSVQRGFLIAVASAVGLELTALALRPWMH